MAMMMTGRVLLVCALCVLWWVFSGVAADGAGGGDGSAGEDLRALWFTRLRRECAEEVIRRTGGRTNASTVEECVRRGLESLRAVVDGRRRWRHQQFAVAAAADIAGNFINPGSSSQGQSGSVAGLEDKTPLEPALEPPPEKLDKAPGNGDALQTPAEIPGPPETRSEKMLNERSEKEVKGDRAPVKRIGEGVSIDIDEEDDGAAEISDENPKHDDGEEATNTREINGGKGSLNREDEISGNHHVSDDISAGLHVALPSVSHVNGKATQSVEGANGTVGEEGPAGQTIVQQAQGSPAPEEPTVEFIQKEDTSKEPKEKGHHVGKGKEQTTVEEKPTEEAAAGNNAEDSHVTEAQTPEQDEPNNTNVNVEKTEEKKNDESSKNEEKSTKDKEREKNAVNSKNEEKEETKEERVADEKETTSVEKKMAAVQSLTKNNTTTPGDSDGSTAVSHATSPLLLLLLVVACAATTAAVVAA
ncbi:Mucin-associated surface protein (MASP), subgroup S133 [Trypanosoma cruzi]|nr:Mucin-associated surface protein (MASP), subgroup S133 [Trypanosoma cruzi]